MFIVTLKFKNGADANLERCFNHLQTALNYAKGSMSADMEQIKVEGQGPQDEIITYLLLENGGTK